MTRILSAAGLAVLATVLAGSLATARPVFACSLFPVDLDRVADGAEIVIVGEVIEERVLASNYAAYESTVRPAAVLKGNPPRDLVIAPVGYLGPDCSGGPRLAEGERVLLFVGRGLLGGDTAGDLQVAAYESGKYTLDADGYARSEYTEEARPAEETIRRVAAITGASTDQLGAALAFARGDAPDPPPVEADPTTAPADNDDANALWLIVALSAAAVAAAAIVIGAALINRRRRSLP